MKIVDIMKKLAVPAASLFLVIAVFSANSASFMWFHQPVEPKEMKKYKKT